MILTWPGGAIQLLCRTRQGRLSECWSSDGGKSWSELDLINLPNPNSGTDAVVLQDGRGLLVYNPTGVPDGKWGGERTPLCVALSEDGRQWRNTITLEDVPGEYSYPAIIQDDTGAVHITYTWRRENVRYCRLELKEIQAI
jgi:alpha-L-rhamnosidase